MMNRNKNEAGFTLVEMLVVITIILLLASFALVKIQGALRDAEKLACQEHLKQIYSEIQRYDTKRKRLPTASGSEFVFSVWGPPFIEKSKNNAEVLFCPSRALPPLSEDTLDDDVLPELIHYAGRNQGEREYKVGRITARNASKKIIVADKPFFDGEECHAGECLCVLYLSGHTAEIERDMFGEEVDQMTIGPGSPIESLQALTGGDDDY